MNPRGDVHFEADGKPWQIAFGLNALITLESLTGRKAMEVFESLDADKGGDVDLKTFRSIFQAGLMRHHPEVTADRAGDLIDTLGIQQSADLIGRAVREAFPEAGEAKAEA